MANVKRNTEKVIFVLMPGPVIKQACMMHSCTTA